MKDTMPWYHTSREIHDQLAELEKTCEGASLNISKISDVEATNGEAYLEVAHVSKGPIGSKIRALMMFGMHARELITVESGLDFLKVLCGKGDKSLDVGSVLEKVSFTVIANTNPIGRMEVEKGYWCKRTNEHNVDLNRNWGDKYRESTDTGVDSETNPGPRGFSEPETRIVRAIIDKEKPDMFVSIHAGAYLLGMPYGDDPNKKMEGSSELKEMLKKVSETHLQGQCPYGVLSEVIGYRPHGCDIDWAYEAGVPYPFELEIYDGDNQHFFSDMARWQFSQGPMPDEAQNFFRTLHERVVHSDEAPRRGADASLVQQIDVRHDGSVGEGRNDGIYPPERDQDAGQCITQFTPQTEQATRRVVEAWTPAYLQLAELAAQRGGRTDRKSAGALADKMGQGKPSRHSHDRPVRHPRHRMHRQREPEVYTSHPRPKLAREEPASTP